MKKNFKIYTIVWVILLAAFNIICFVSPSELAGMSKFEGSFWVGYIFIILAFVGQLVCAYFAFKAENLQKLFYNLPLITVSYTGLILTIIFGSLCMAIPNLPNWIGTIICLLILIFIAIAVIKAKAAGDVVFDIDKKVKTQTSFITMTTVNAQNIMNRAKNNTVRAKCKKVYEALRYSDPISSDTLSAENAKITVKMDELAAAVDKDTENAAIIAEEILTLVKERNNKCKIFK